MSSSAFFIEAAANTVTVFSSATARDHVDASRTVKVRKIPARRGMMALRACSRARIRARKPALAGSRDATGGSAVPLVRRIYDRSGHRGRKPTASLRRGKASVLYRYPPEAGEYRSFGRGHDRQADRAGFDAGNLDDEGFCGNFELHALA